MKGYIEHSGVIESIMGTHIRVQIVQAAACSGCKAKSLCTSSEMKEKCIDVYDSNPERWAVGEAVNVRGTLSMGKSAVRIAFGGPILIIVFVLIVSKLSLHLSDGWSVLLAFGAVGIYSLVLYLLRDMLSKKFVMWIEKGGSSAV